jgi:hypothetical protein
MIIMELALIVLLMVSIIAAALIIKNYHRSKKPTDHDVLRQSVEEAVNKKE